MTVQFDFWELQEIAVDIAGAGPEAEAGAMEVVEKVTIDAQAIAMEGAPYKTGFLQSSIGREVNGLEAEFGPTANYGIYVEFGTSRMDGRPYMTPAYDYVERVFPEGIRQVTGRIL